MSDFRELIGNKFANQLMDFHRNQANIWTQLPGIITSVNLVNMTAEVQPAIKTRYFKEDGTTTDMQIPVLLDCPIIFTSGGGVTFTFPINVGDECLIFFSSRCIDNWWSTGQVSTQAELRMHDLSDGFVLPGIKSLPNVIHNISSTTAQLRSNDGNTFIELDPVHHNVNVSTTGSVNITAPITTINGDVHVTGTLTSDVDVIGGGKSLKSHIHSGVQSGSSNTGAPV